MVASIRKTLNAAPRDFAEDVVGVAALFVLIFVSLSLSSIF